MAGAGYKLFNTGDVLTAAQVNTYLQEQVVMVFNDATARTTALSGVLAEGMVSYLKSTDAVEIYNGSAWVGIAADQTPLTTKGDLFTYSTTDARLGVGNNGETLVADSSATTGLRWTATPAASNPVLNSSFDIWQRGTSISLAASSGITYTADRWCMNTGANQATTVSRQSVSDSTNLPNIQYCARIQRNSGQTGTGTLAITQSFETVNSIPFANKTVTLSFYARAGSNFSATSNILSSYLITGTGTDQNRLSGAYTGDNASMTTTSTLTTTWQRFTLTGTLSNTTNELAVWFQYNPTGTASTNDYFEITGVQIDIGNTALPYRRNSVTLAGELAACMRYYQALVLSFGVSHTTGQAYTTAAATIPISLRVPMRGTPSITIAAAGSGNGQVTCLTSTGTYPGTTGTLTASRPNENGFEIAVAGFTGAFTAGNATLFYTGGSSGTTTVYTASAEL